MEAQALRLGTAFNFARAGGNFAVTLPLHYRYINVHYRYTSQGGDFAEVEAAAQIRGSGLDLSGLVLDYDREGRAALPLPWGGGRLNPLEVITREHRTTC